MSGRKPHSSPAVASAENGEVIVDGPNGFAYSMTPPAAEQSAASLAAAARRAREQQVAGGTDAADDAYVEGETPAVHDVGEDLDH